MGDPACCCGEVAAPEQTADPSTTSEPEPAAHSCCSGGGAVRTDEPETAPDAQEEEGPVRGGSDCGCEPLVSAPPCIEPQPSLDQDSGPERVDTPVAIHADTLRSQPRVLAVHAWLGRRTSCPWTGPPLRILHQVFLI